MKYLDPNFVEEVPLRIDIAKPTNAKCERCWKYISLDDNIGLCLRCFDIIWDYNERRNIVIDPEKQTKPRRYWVVTKLVFSIICQVQNHLWIGSSVLHVVAISFSNTPSPNFLCLMLYYYMRIVQTIIMCKTQE